MKVVEKTPIHRGECRIFWHRTSLFFAWKGRKRCPLLLGTWHGYRRLPVRKQEEERSLLGVGSFPGKGVRRGTRGGCQSFLWKVAFPIERWCSSPVLRQLARMPFFSFPLCLGRSRSCVFLFFFFFLFFFLVCRKQLMDPDTTLFSSIFSFREGEAACLFSSFLFFSPLLQGRKKTCHLPSPSPATS